VTSDHAMREKALAAAKMATLGEMATGLAHELNQPISIMSLAAENAAEMLRLSGPAAIDAAVRRMGRICDQSNRARTIINHLRVFGHRGETELTEVSLSRIVDGALSIVDAAMRAAEIMVENQVTDDVPTVTGGTVMAEQVLVNVLLNARDALAQIARSRGRHIRIHTDRDFLTRSVSLVVTDNGPGVPPDLRERIFEPFFTTKEVGKGTGLGLAICHGIMKSFGGSIAVEDNEDGGARFVMRFMQAETGLAQLVRGSTAVMPQVLLN
jgi:C4-dicarboxylate-specific signal transduction histidine kinase